MKYTYIEMIDKVYDHFIMKNKPFGVDRVTKTCEYHAGIGVSCAIGIFDSGEVFRGGINTVEHFRESVLKKVFGEVNEDDIEFLKELQAAHDYAALNGTKDVFRRSLQNLKKEYET